MNALLKNPQIFICYAHQDNESPEPSKRWLNRLLEQLKPLQLTDKADIWSDQRIELGADWNNDIQTTLQQASAVVLLVSPSFLASEYIRNSELPVLLYKAKNEGVCILPVLVRQCMWKETTFKYPDAQTGPEEMSLSLLQAPTTKPLNSLPEHEQDEVLYQIAQRINNIIKTNKKNPVQRQPEPQQPTQSPGMSQTDSELSPTERLKPMRSKIDIGIIVALREEFRELYSQLPSHKAIRIPETGDYDYLFTWGTDNNSYSCAATFVGDMGLKKAALATERFLGRCQPKTIVWLGIAGGINKDVKLGDVVVVTTATDYLAKSKAVSGEVDSFVFEVGGDFYRCSDDLIQSVQNLEFAHPTLYQQWQSDSKKKLESIINSQQLQKEWIRKSPDFLAGAIASGEVVGASVQFSNWLKENNRNYLALEMEGAGMLSAVYSQAIPQKTLILRGISDFGDERKKELDEIGKGDIRRYAMNNAINFLWKLLEAQVLPKKK